MKKTLSMLLAVIIAVFTISTMAVTVFAAPDTDATTKNDDVPDPYAATTAPAVTTTKAPTTAAPTTAAPTTAAPTTTKAPVSQTAKISDQIVTLAPGATAIDEGPSTTTKKAAAVVNSNPSTGSNLVVPAVAFLALTAGVVAVVKTKKDED